jgi:PKD repeat protein
MLLPLVLKMGPPVTTLTQGAAGGSWSAQWLGGVTTSTSGYTGNWIFCPGSGTVKTVCSAPIVAISQSGAGITQTSNPGTPTYNFAGLYNATLKIADTPEAQIGTAPAGNTATMSFLVNVTGSTPAYAVSVSADNNSPGAATVVTLKANATYTSSYPGSFRASKFNYVFDFGDGTPTVTVSQNQTATVQHTFPSSGSFMVKVVAQEYDPRRAPSQIEENGFLRIRPLCPSTSSCDFVLPTSSPAVGQTVTFTASAAGGVSPYVFKWDFGDGSTGTGSSVSHTYHSSGTFNVTLTITDSSGQTQTIKKTVTIGGGGGPGFDFGSFLTSPLGLGLIAAAAIIILGASLFLRRRGSRPAPAQVSP